MNPHTPAKDQAPYCGGRGGGGFKMITLVHGLLPKCDCGIKNVHLQLVYFFLLLCH